VAGPFLFGSKQNRDPVEGEYEPAYGREYLMTSPIPGFSGASAASSVPGAEKEKSKTLGDRDTFLKLLVAQLKYQDPSNPADSTQFLAQTAQFTQVEKLGEIARMLSAQQLINASALVGRTVTYQDANGSTQSGVVTKTKLNGDSEPTLVVGNTDVQLSKVTEVQQTATTSESPTTKEA
jgi:flagellar basal-body rod modification protein FlgD